MMSLINDIDIMALGKQGHILASFAVWVVELPDSGSHDYAGICVGYCVSESVQTHFWHSSVRIHHY